MPMETLKQALDHYGVEMNMVIAMEECGELTQAISKYIRYADYPDGLGERADAIREEIADVRIMLDMLELIFGSTDKWRAAKLRRMERRISETSEPEKEENAI